MNQRPPRIDRGKLRTVPVRRRPSKVRLRDEARPHRAGASFAGIGLAGFTPTTFWKNVTNAARPVGTFGLC